MGAESNTEFYLVEEEESIKVYVDGGNVPILTFNTQEDFRPFIHPILSPGTEVELTQYSPDHHKHQTGVYWGFTRVNGSDIDKKTLYEWFYRKDKPQQITEQIGRDYFHNPGEGFWKKVDSEMLIELGKEVKWQSVYHMLDETGNPILEETQIWTFSQNGDKYLASLEWKGKGIEEVTINEFDYGGLFVRMPWRPGVEGEAVNAARQINEKAEGQRAMWVDIGLQIDGLDERGHIAILDHPDNEGFPTTWRVDGQLGVGPVRARLGDWTIAKGETVTFRHQLVAYSGTLSDIEMNAIWGDFVGDHGMYNTASLWGIAQEEGRNAVFLTPEDAVRSMTIKEGFEVNVYCSEPVITQPMAFCWDDKGRLWIAENRDYESRGHGFSNSGDSKILILEDTDKDGTIDKQTTFLEDIPFPAAIAVGFDGLFLGAPPNLLYVPDRDGDDKADVDDIEIRLTGWGIRDRHETINSFHWGPDGWLYGLEGFATPSKIRKPEGKGRIYRAGEPFPQDLLDADGVDINGGVWRYHPTKDLFEVVAHGFSNPWGIDYDAKGQMFITACVIPHLFHVIPGGIYHRQGGSHFNPYVYQDIQTIVDHRHRSAHGGARVYLSDAFPEEHHGRLFMANIHEHAVLSDELHANGSGFRASHGEDFLLANNAQWIGFSMEIGPDGGLYVLDWHDADICGKEVLNKETGRVFRIMPQNNQAENWEGRFGDLNELSDRQLAALQTSKSSWHARRARVILQSKAHKNSLDPSVREDLMAILNGSNGDHRLRALWTLHITELLSDEQLRSLLKDDDPYVRSWAIQFIFEEGHSQEDIELISDLAKSERSAVTRLYLAAAMQRISVTQRFQLARELVVFEEDQSDPNIPHMLWFGIEPIIEENINQAIQLAEVSKIDLITENIARRMVDADQLAILSDRLADKFNSKESLLKGILAGLEGRYDIAEPSSWSSMYNTFSSDSKLGQLARQINQQFGNAAAAEEMIAALTNDNASRESKENAIKNLARLQRDELKPLLAELFEDEDLRIASIRAMAAYDEMDYANLLIGRFDQMELQERQEALQTLSSRPLYGWMLTNAIRDDLVTKRDVPAYIALQLRRVVGNGFVEIWGPIDDISSDLKSEFQKYQRLLSDEAISNSDPVSGHKIFQRVCMPCHQMYGEGGNLGPDLTGSNRTNTSYLLSNVLDPSGELQDDYRMVIITTRDGRTYSGNIESESERQLELRTVGLENVVLNQTDIQSKEVSPKSMMPEGLFSTLTDQEVLDLVAYMKVLNES